MEKNIIGGHYQILHTLYEDSSYCAAIGRDISVRENNITYLLNIYHSNPLKQKAAPCYTKISGNTCRYFIEFFVDSSDLVSVFDYNEFIPLVRHLENKDLNLKSRLLLCCDLLLELVRNDNIPTLIKLSLLKPDNIVVDQVGKLYLNFLINFDDAYEAFTPEAELKIPYFSSILSIMSSILGNEKKQPEKLKKFISGLQAQEFEKTSTFYSEFKAFAESLIQESESENKNLENKAKGIGARLVKKLLKIPSAVIIFRIFIVILVLAVLSGGGYYIYRYILENTITTDSGQPSTNSQIIDNKKVITPSQQTAETHSTTSGSPPDQSANEEYYTVQKGDSLSEIAKKYYGDSEKYILIKEANSLKSTTIHEGMKLKIPKDN